MKSIVTIGGGTGQFTLLTGLKKYPVRLTAIVSMADDGGSTGVLRDELGVLPPGDIRQCLVALSESETVMRDLFNYRYDQGGLKGHNFGNIFLSTLEKMTGSVEEAVRVAGMVLAVRGEVIPVTTSDTRLVCGKENVCRGEHVIDVSVLKEKDSLRLEPEVYANPKAASAIEQADCVVIGPGDLYTSIIPNLLVKGVPEAIARSSATVVFNCNLMNKAGHTDGFTVRDYVDEIEKRIGRGRVNFVTYNNRMPERELLEKYGEEGKSLVAVAAEDEDFGETAFRPLPADLISARVTVPKSGDQLKRTFIRHDPDALAALIIDNCLGGV
ncbi:MAG: YvcK family protein [Patescibacteria group bacterium]|nr:YvcK family protein [Patescibacteria group bacterium]